MNEDVHSIINVEKENLLRAGEVDNEISFAALHLD